METDNHCKYCMLVYDSKNRLPFSGLCGHVYCAMCITNHKLRECPTCGDTEAFSVATCNFDFLEKLNAAENLLLFVNHAVVHQPSILEMRNETKNQLVPINDDTSDEDDDAEVEAESDHEEEEEDELEEEL